MLKSVFFFFIFFFIFVHFHFGQGAWNKKADCPTQHNGLYYFAFSIEDKGYLSNFCTNSIPSFWEYDPKTDVWTQKSKFPGELNKSKIPGVQRSWERGFSIGNKGYIGLGADNTPMGLLYNDFWEYDPAADRWTRKWDFPGGLRYAANVSFTIANKGYIGTGMDSSKIKSNEFWEYDPYSPINGKDGNGNPMGAWTRKADFGAHARNLACGFSIDNKGYIGTGYDDDASGGMARDFWEYDPSTDKWTKKANVPGLARAEAASFSMGGYGYIGIGTSIIGTGSMKDFWKYDPVLDSWSAIPDFGAGIWEMTGAFTIGCSAYIVGGFPNDAALNNSSFPISLWQYKVSCFDISKVEIKCHNGSDGSIAIINQPEKNTYTWSPDGQTSSSISGLSAGNYTLTMVDSLGISDNKIISLIDPDPIIINISSSLTICTGQNASFTAIATGGTPGYSYSWNNGLSTGKFFNVSPPVTTTYFLAVTDLKHCSADTLVIVEVNPLPTVIAANNTICFGNTTTLSASGAEQYKWEPSTALSSASGAVISANPQSTTHYTVTGTNSKFCSKDTFLTLTISPLPTVECGINLSINGGESVMLNANGTGNYSWYPIEGLSCISCKKTLASPLSTTTYYLILTDSIGCLTKDSLTIWVNQQIYIPSSFTPNGDDINDVFYVYGDFSSIDLKIYDRWGEMIFQSKNSSTGWDGKFKGKPVQEDNYIYILNVRNSFNNEMVYRGKIVLIR